MSVKSILSSSRMVKFIAGFAITAGVAALSVPTAAEAGPPSGRVAIMNAHSNLCLSPAGGNRNLNDQTVQFNCDADPSRFWSFTHLGGDIVVALIDEEEATLKRFRRRGASIALEPANTAYEVRILPPNRVRIQGKLIGLYRKY